MSEKKPWTAGRIARWAVGAFLLTSFVSAMLEPRKEQQGTASSREAANPVAVVDAKQDPPIPQPPVPIVPLGGNVGGFAKVFNDKSKRLSAGVRIAKGSCGTEVRTACDYTLTDGVSIIAGSSADKKTLESLTIHLLTDDKMVVLRYFSALGVILNLYAPTAGKDEVGSVVGQLVTKIGKGNSADAVLHGVSVRILLVQPFGSLTSISRQ
ncbi:hypothetical protein [Xanthobacter autotrophicus]|uniref:hypothetical protein n=1 Tax=Xanthobacter autotrophicus TaxID=280 RepID=UPI0024A795CF|nr:hypothetical protein [Xanthobacter autotrophicus]MDI4655561.1 hypothetical protein [Xanthobacter autotrophicus]